ncbi:ribosome silencing factor [Desertivirga xinjiangensis]|uniref:ribosome silencing factor n=1 Tax=Desertivirga xinjiangensis TaxID=539206 RepID=UPI00210A86A0|nr:ribosome silencing factor [Pedobacter xinjiangensis]
MVKSKAINESTFISELVIHGIQEKKGNEIVRLDLRNIHSSIADYFVICHAESSTQVRAIASSVEEEVFKASNQLPVRVEGLEYGEWVLLDYVDTIVHIFKTEKRQFYGIEELWGDAEMKSYKSA